MLYKFYRCIEPNKQRRDCHEKNKLLFWQLLDLYLSLQEAREDLRTTPKL